MKQREKEWERERKRPVQPAVSTDRPVQKTRIVYETRRWTRPGGSNKSCRKQRPFLSSRRRSIGRQAPRGRWSVARNHAARLLIWSSSARPGLSLSLADRREGEQVVSKQLGRAAREPSAMTMWSGHGHRYVSPCTNSSCMGSGGSAVSGRPAVATPSLDPTWPLHRLETPLPMDCAEIWGVIIRPVPYNDERDLQKSLPAFYHQNRPEHLGWIVREDE